MVGVDYSTAVRGLAKKHTERLQDDNRLTASMLTTRMRVQEANAAQRKKNLQDRGITGKMKMQTRQMRENVKEEEEAVVVTEGNVRGDNQKVKEF